MKTKKAITIVITIVILFIGFVISVITNQFFSIAVVIGLEGMFLLQGLRKIENDPPHKGIVTILGKRQYKERNGEKITVYTNEGWRFFPFCPFVFDYVPVNVERKSFEIKTTTRTPDRAEVEITITLSLRPLNEHLLEYENNGGFEGVKKHLSGEIEERVREWAEGIQEGPRDWREIYQAKLETTSILIEGVARNQFTKIPKEAQEVPTHVWFRYFSKPRPEINELMANEKKWAENDWEKVKLVAEKLDRRLQELQEAVGMRKLEIQKVRSDQGELNIFDLGIRLERLNISNVRVIGEAAKAADQQAKEREEREAEILEMEHVENLINQLMERFPKIPFLELRRIVQTERGKTPMKINELNLSSETLSVLSGILNVLKGGK